MRRFVVIGHTAASAPGFSLNQLASTGGRIDVLVRCVGAALLVSHGLRPDAEIVTLHLGSPGPTKAVRFDPKKMKHLFPDERSTAAMFEKALGAATTGPVWAEATPGVSVAVTSLDELLSSWREPVVLLREDAPDAATVELPRDATFVVGDHLGFTPEEETLLSKRAALAVSLGPVSLQAEQCITVLHNRLDRA
jgi:tRNA (pseudouridine54-N1)-methyltransferase